MATLLKTDCPNCHTTPGGKYCRECGEELIPEPGVIRCSGCQMKLNPRDKFCFSCGQRREA